MTAGPEVSAQAHISKFFLYNINRKMQKSFGKEIMKISLIFFKILEKDAGQPYNVIWLKGKEDAERQGLQRWI